MGTKSVLKAFRHHKRNNVLLAVIILLRPGLDKKNRVNIHIHIYMHISVFNVDLYHLSVKVFLLGCCTTGFLLLLMFNTAEIFVRKPDK